MDRLAKAVYMVWVSEFNKPFDVILWSLVGNIRSAFESIRRLRKVYTEVDLPLHGSVYHYMEVYIALHVSVLHYMEVNIPLHGSVYLEVCTFVWKYKPLYGSVHHYMEVYTPCMGMAHYVEVCTFIWNVNPYMRVYTFLGKYNKPISSLHSQNKFEPHPIKWK